MKKLLAWLFKRIPSTTTDTQFPCVDCERDDLESYQREMSHRVRRLETVVEAAAEAARPTGGRHGIS